MSYSGFVVAAVVGESVPSLFGDVVFPLEIKSHDSLAGRRHAMTPPPAL